MGNAIIHNRRFASGGGGGGGSLTLGETYSFGGYDWICAELFNDYAVLQSKGVTSGYWPGYVMTGPTTGTGDWGAANTGYNGDIDGADISGYDNIMETLFAVISPSEYSNATYGSGLYLIDKTMVGVPVNATSTSGSVWVQLEDFDLTGNKVNYHNALKTAAGKSTFAWCGTHINATHAWLFNTNGLADGISYGVWNNYSIAPAFNVDLSKISVSSNNVITVI